MPTCEPHVALDVSLAASQAAKSIRKYAIRLSVRRFVVHLARTRAADILEAAVRQGKESQAQGESQAEDQTEAPSLTECMSKGPVGAGSTMQGRVLEALAEALGKQLDEQQKRAMLLALGIEEVSHTGRPHEDAATSVPDHDAGLSQRVLEEMGTLKEAVVELQRGQAALLAAMAKNGASDGQASAPSITNDVQARESIRRSFHPSGSPKVELML